MSSQEYTTELDSYLVGMTQDFDMKPGRTKASLDVVFRFLYPFQIGGDVMELYSRCGGTDANDMFFSHSDLLSPENAVKEYEDLKRVSRDIGVRWPEALFTVGMTQTYTLVLLEAEDHFSSQVFIFDPSEGDLTIYQEYPRLIDNIIALNSDNNSFGNFGEKRPIANLDDAGSVPSEWYF